MDASVRAVRLEGRDFSLLIRCGRCTWVMGTELEISQDEIDRIILDHVCESPFNLTPIIPLVG